VIKLSLFSGLLLDYRKMRIFYFQIFSQISYSNSVPSSYFLTRAVKLWNCFVFLRKFVHNTIIGFVLVLVIHQLLIKGNWDMQQNTHYASV